MVRLSDLHPEEAAHLANLPPSTIAPGDWITPKPLADSTIALITTAGLHRRDDAPFAAGAIDYRLIPGDVDFADLVSSHVSVNWDRSALEQDANVVLPLERLRELAAAGEIGAVWRAGTTRSWAACHGPSGWSRPRARWDACSSATASMRWCSRPFDRSARAPWVRWRTSSSGRGSRRPASRWSVSTAR